MASDLKEHLHRAITAKGVEAEKAQKFIDDHVAVVRQQTSLGPGDDLTDEAIDSLRGSMDHVKVVSGYHFSAHDEAQQERFTMAEAIQEALGPTPEMSSA